jgi:energy-coupling factor transporter ATP-binding protein EcfA2
MAIPVAMTGLDESTITAARDSRYNRRNMDIFEKDTQEYVIKTGRPILLIGEHGVGKTSVLRSMADNFNLNMHELNAGTLDPFVHIVGIPVTANGKVTMSPPDELLAAELLFIDEINRSDRQTRNALFEIICDKSINGKKLPNLKMIVAAMNPPDGQYQVDALDKALNDRFLHTFQVGRDISFALDKLDEKHRPAVRKWYEALEEPPSPRRLTWVAESAFDGENINEGALLNALDDNLYSTRTLISMLTNGIASTEKLQKDSLLSEDEKQLIAEIFYGASQQLAAEEILLKLKSQYVMDDNTTFLPIPVGELTEEQKKVFQESEHVKEVNDLFNFPFHLKAYSGRHNDNTWLSEVIG